MDIWCLFSVANNYDQPDNNLVAWWRKRPTFESLMNAIEGSLDEEEAVIACANMLQLSPARFGEYNYRLEQVKEGETLPKGSL